MKMLNHRWMIIALCATAANGYTADSYKSRSLNPFHERQILQDINQSAAKAQACSDLESRSKELQELCKKLIQAEKYDEALKIADQVYRCPNINAERKAAHHYMIADIYHRKMQASPNMEHMKQNRDLARQAAQDVINQKYPAKWGVTSMANNLLRTLEDPQQLARVQDKVSKKQSNGVDANHANLAQKQLAYMESMAKGTARAGGSGFSAIKKTGSSLFSFGRKEQVVEEPKKGFFSRRSSDSAQQQAAHAAVASLPQDRSSVSLPGAGQVTFSQSQATTAQAVNSPWSIKSAAATGGSRAPIIIDGATVRRSNPVQNNTVASSGGFTISGQNVRPGSAATSTAPTYAAGELPSLSARN